MKTKRAFPIAALSELALAAGLALLLSSCSQPHEEPETSLSPVGIVVGFAPKRDGSDPRLMEYYLEILADGAVWCGEPGGREVRGAIEDATAGRMRIRYTAAVETEPWEAQGTIGGRRCPELLPPDALDEFEFPLEGGLLLVESGVGHPVGAWHLVSIEMAGLGRRRANSNGVGDSSVKDE